MKNIKVSEAEIETVSVAVHVVRISGKQMTLAVFKQLAVEDLLDPRTGELKGVPWGWVNYHVHCPAARRRNSFFVGPSSVHSYIPHLHVIWQKGDELRHAVVYAPDRNPAQTAQDREIQQRWQEQYERLLELPQLFIAV
ncbi:hypothetical protein SDD30_15265 [Moorella naiadis]|uniref:hypothetical protein n=1 Tax=Moorella naiadis (nom. illeg.) TaxID=3093670 RepID=UPI003D9C8E72